VEPVEYRLMDAVEDGMWWYRAVHARVLDELSDRPGTPGLVLDAGCGTGGLLRRLAASRPARPLVGVEYNPDAARRARQKSGAEVIVGSVNQLPIGDARVGALLSVDVLCHGAVDQEAALAEYRRVMAPGATLIVNLPAYAWLSSAHDRRVHTVRRYTSRSITGVLNRAGFEMVQTRYWNSLLFPLMVLQRKVLARGRGQASDVAPFPAWLNASFCAVTEAERSLARAGLRWPGGGSVLAVATRS
jgi:ubiquinone/menaquinone biosynthesis C-methylase UbiE